MIWIILPVHNEQDTIVDTINSTVRWCRNNLESFVIVFVDDHSTDATINRIRHVGFEHIRLIENTLCPGKGSALTFAFLHLRREVIQEDVVVFMDGDGQIEISDIEVFLKIMDLYNADVVIGNKRHPYSLISYKLLRSVVSKSYNFIIRKLFNLSFTDTQCGLKMFKFEALDRIRFDVTTSGFAFDIDLLVALKKYNYRIVDAPVRIGKQINNGSVNVKNIITTLIDTIKIFVKYKKHL